MNILHALYQPRSGAGTLQVVQDLAAAAQRRGHRVHILARNSQVFDLEGVEPFFTGHKLQDAWRLWGRLSDWDVVHVHDRYCSLLIRSIPSAPPSLQTNHIRYQTHRQLTRFADVVVACSEAMDRHHEHFFRLPTSRRVCIPNGVSLKAVDAPRLSLLRDRIPASIQGKKLCLTVGRLEPQKGHTYLLQAIAQLPAPVRQDWAFVWAGDGSLAAELRQQIQALGLSDSILELGFTRDIPEWLALSDAFVLPSLYEGLPLALLEALGNGLPIVATAVDGNREVIHPNGNGLLCEPADPASLAQALQQLLSDDALRIRLAAQARNDYHQFWTFERTWHQYEQVYEQLFHRGRIRLARSTA